MPGFAIERVPLLNLDTGGNFLRVFDILSDPDRDLHLDEKAAEKTAVN